MFLYRVQGGRSSLLCTTKWKCGIPAPWLYRAHLIHRWTKTTATVHRNPPEPMFSVQTWMLETAKKGLYLLYVCLYFTDVCCLVQDIRLVWVFPHGEQTLSSWWANFFLVVSKRFPHGEQTFPSWWANVVFMVSKRFPHGEQTLSSWWANFSLMVSKRCPHGEQTFSSWWANVFLVVSKLFPRDSKLSFHGKLNLSTW